MNDAVIALSSSAIVLKLALNRVFLFSAFSHSHGFVSLHLILPKGFSQGCHLACILPSYPYLVLNIITLKQCFDVIEGNIISLASSASEILFKTYVGILEKEFWPF